MFTVARKLALLRAKRGYVALAIAALSVVAGFFGNPGMWDGPL